MKRTRYSAKIHIAERIVLILYVSSVWRGIWSDDSLRLCDKWACLAQHICEFSIPVDDEAHICSRRHVMSSPLVRAWVNSKNLLIIHIWINITIKGGPRLQQCHGLNPVYEKKFVYQEAFVYFSFVFTKQVFIFYHHSSICDKTIPGNYHGFLLLCSDDW